MELLPLFLGVVLAQLAPGPNLVAVAQTAMANGRRAGIATAAAIGFGNGLWALIFTLGIGGVLTERPVLLHLLSLLGGGYLCWLGLSALWRAWRNPVSSSLRPGQARALRAAFRHGLAINLTNPKAALLWASVSVYLAGLGLSSWALLAAALGVVGSALLVYGGYAILFSTGRAMRGYGQAARGIEAATGAVFGALGGRLVWDGIQGLRG